MRLSHERPAQIARLLFTVAMGIAWCGAPRLARAQQAGGAAAPQAGSEIEQIRQMADALQSTARICAQIDRDLPREEFDPTAIVARVGRDPAALFAWVRDNTRYTPYRGVLRGAAGVLMDREGNSLDRSLLLAALLAEAGVRARLARGRLTADQAEQLLKSAWEQRRQPAAAPPPTDQEIAAAAEQAAAKYGLDPAQTRANADQRRLEGQKLREELAGGVLDQTERLAALVRPAGDARPDAPGVPTERSNALEAVADHTWVQYEDSSKWVDLDALKADAEPGAALAKVYRTVGLTQAGAAVPPALDKSLVHEVEVRVVIERWKAGRAETRVPLKHVLRPAELRHRPVALAVMGLDSRPKLDVDKPDLPRQLRDALSKQTRWAAFLAAGSEVVAQKGFDDSGELINSPGDDLAKAGDTLAKRPGAATGLFDQLGTPPGAAPGSARRGGAGVLTAAWIEFEFRRPGAESRVVRRDVMDVYGPGRRAAGALTDPNLDEAARMRRAAALSRQVDLLPVGCVLPASFGLHLELDAFVRNAPAVVRALRTAGPAGGEAAGPINPAFQQLMQVRMVPGPLLSLASARGGAQAFLGGAGAAVDQPNLFALHTEILVGPDGALVARRTIDIVANEVLIRPAAEGATDAFAAQLRQGVLDTHLERFALSGRGTVGNTADLFSASQAQNIRWVTVRRQDDPALSELALGDDARARISADLRSGYIVVAPVAPVKAGALARAGWWRVDPNSGSCVGMSEDGMGSAMTEHAIHEMWLLVALGHWFYEAYHCFSDLGQQRGFRCAVCSFLVMWATEGVASFVHGPALILHMTGLNATFATHGFGHMCHDWAAGGNH